ncbi:dynamin family protein [Exiguobacterium sp. MER 193]|uniref:dynamin family protein n=1 Tax=Exiguobacterium sp. MER 193 TaxID=2939564 RepID=UPI00203AEAE8|nr:dynamin family protein [Exiguobacterium sp. MER 193]MCM3281283.1 dynamin family protein [Exiguobacterium sp. MER 193]
MWELTRDKLSQAEAVLNQEEILIVVVGEFNHGKTTFVNSLLRQDLLPMGILPTTATVNIIGKGNRKIEVHEGKSATTVEAQALVSYIGDADVSQIDWIAIRDPLVPFEPPVFLVDTPGLNDVNKRRSDVAYRFIPKADIIFFLLKADQPISETELVFLKETLLEEGLERIVFVMNFADAFEDEEEELEEMMDDLRRTLETIDGITNPVIIPFDAKGALREAMVGDTTAVDVLVRQIEAFQKEGTDRLRRPRYELMYKQILDTFNHERELTEQLSEMKRNELEAMVGILEVTETTLQAHFIEISSYLDTRRNELLLMIDKSVDHLHDEWVMACNRVVKRYQGPASQFMTVIEQDLEHLLNVERKRWVEKYTPQLERYVANVQSEVKRSIREATTEQTVVLWKQIEETEIGRHDILFRPPFTFQGQDPTITAGLFAGGAAAVMMGLGGGLLLPFVGLAAYPMIRKHLEEKALEEAKQLVLLEIDGIVSGILKELKHELESYVIRMFEQMESVTHEQATRYYQKQREQLEQQLKQSEHAETMRLQTSSADVREIETAIARFGRELERRLAGNGNM